MRKSRSIAFLCLFLICALAKYTTRANSPGPTEEIWEWKLVEPAPTQNSLTSVAYGNGRFVAVGNKGVVLTSTDGRNWTRRNSGVSHAFRTIAFGNGLFVAVGERQAGWHSEWVQKTEGVIITSPDGVTWTTRWAKADLEFLDISFGNGRFVIVGSITEITQFQWKSLWRGTVFTSLDGISWKEGLQTFGDRRPINNVAFGNGGWLIHNGSGEAWSSLDGVNWDLAHREDQIRANNTGPAVGGDLVFLSDLDGFLAIGGARTPDWDGHSVAHLHSSRDGSSWECHFGGCNALANSYPPMYSVISLNHQQVFVGEGILTRQGPEVIWTELGYGSKMALHQFSRPVSLQSIAVGASAIVAVGAGQSLGTDSSGLSWSAAIVYTERKQAAIAMPLNQALDTPSRVWLTGDSAPWFGQTKISHDATASAQSGSLKSDQESWLETEFSGPGTLSFWWNLSTGYWNWDDELNFRVNGEVQATRGVMDKPGADVSWTWSQHTFDLTNGRHKLRWTFRKGGSVIDVGGASWLDEIRFEPDFIARPELRLFVAAGKLTLSWPMLPEGFLLHSTANLADPNSWFPVPEAPVLVNQQNTVTLSLTNGVRFFRLQRQ